MSWCTLYAVSWEFAWYALVVYGYGAGFHLQIAIWSEYIFLKSIVRVVCQDVRRVFCYRVWGWYVDEDKATNLNKFCYAHSWAAVVLVSCLAFPHARVDSGVIRFNSNLGLKAHLLRVLGWQTVRHSRCCAHKQWFWMMTAKTKLYCVVLFQR